ncbi:MAG: efflux RND transporter periplasmic adaptor subunit [Sulfurimonas sp.]|nr:efflux RND transporter periplasmic adaptor subunit [Sulfurimonas sp.]
MAFNKNIKNYIAVGFVSILFILAGYFVYEKLNPIKLASNLITGSGRIDGDLILLNTKYPARIESILVEEGDTVSLHQTVATLKSDEFKAKNRAMSEAIQSLKNEKLSYAQSIEAKTTELALLKNTLPQLVKISKEKIKTLQNALKILLLNIEKVELEYTQYKKDHKRRAELYEDNLISGERFELSTLKYEMIKKEISSLKLEKNRVQNSISSAKSGLEIDKENLKKIIIAQQNLKASQSKLLSLEYKVKELIASKDEIEAMIDALTLHSPVDGFVIEKIANKGEVIGAGSGVLTLSDTHSYYLKLFVDTINNGKIKIGDKAVIFVDAYPNTPIEAKVIKIAQRAEFTPKNVSVRSDRIQRVYAIHIKPLKYNPILKLGIPAIGVVSIDSKGLPHSLSDMPEI